MLVTLQHCDKCVMIGDHMEKCVNIWSNIHPFHLAQFCEKMIIVPIFVYQNEVQQSYSSSFTPEIFYE
jgi:hypothetical protein